MATGLGMICLLAVLPCGQGARLRAKVLAPTFAEASLEKEMFDLSQFLTKTMSNVSANASKAGSLAVKAEANPSGTTPKENPKCDQACTNGSKDRRAKCMVQCDKMQKLICDPKFSCHNGCANDNQNMPLDPKCEILCNEVHDRVCYPFVWEASNKSLSPHHDEKPPPSIEATPAPKIYTGSFMFCNLYPAGKSFDIVKLKDATAKDGESMAKLGYKECQEITMDSLEAVGLKIDGKLSGVSKPIDKTPSVMLFGQFALGNHQVDFNRYFAKGDGPIVCNGMPVWESKDDGEKVQMYRDGKTLASLRYKECIPTGLQNGEVLKAEIKNKTIGEYKVTESPKVIVFGKAGESGAVAFEAWTKGPETGF